MFVFLRADERKGTFLFLAEKLESELKVLASPLAVNLTRILEPGESGDLGEVKVVSAVFIAMLIILFYFILELNFSSSYPFEIEKPPSFIVFLVTREAV